MKAKLSIGTWAYIFNQETPTNDFHVVLHKLQDLGYDGVELGSFGAHPTPGVASDQGHRAKTEERDRRSWPGAFRHRRRSVELQEARPVDHGREPDALHCRVSRLRVLRGRSGCQDHPRRFAWSRPTSSRQSGMDLKQGHGAHRQRLGQVQQDGSRLRHERLLGVRAGLCLQQAFGSRADRRCSARQGQPKLRRALRHLPRPHVCCRSAPTSSGSKETLPGGELELLEKLKGQDHPRPRHRQRRQPQRAQHQHAQPVRHRQAELRQARSGDADSAACRITGGASICASGRTPGT